MNIVEKKCPNCNANLEFQVGEKDVKCPHCRRAFAIEYDHEIDPEIQMKAKDITLKIMKDFEQGQKISKVVGIFIFVVAALIITFATIMVVRGFIETDQRREEFHQRQEQDQKRQDEMDEAQKQMEERVLEMIDEQSKQMKSAN